MKKHSTIIVASAMAALLLVFAGCASTPSATASNAPSAATVSADATVASASAGTTDKVFTVAELKKYNGQNGNPAYVAVDGTVYDVTIANQWNNGSHHGLTAGQDLSKEIKNAPHGTSVLQGLPVVGKLK